MGTTFDSGQGLPVTLIVDLSISGPLTGVRHGAPNHPPKCMQSGMCKHPAQFHFKRFYSMISLKIVKIHPFYNYYTVPIILIISFYEKQTSHPEFVKDKFSSVFLFFILFKYCGEPIGLSNKREFQIREGESERKVNTS